MGLLIKYIKPVPLNQSYRKRAFKDFLLFIGLLAAIGALSALLFGCSLEKKIAKTYRNAEAYNPLTKVDSLHLIRAAKKVIKSSDKPKVEKIRVPYPVIKLKTVLDTNAIQQITDSLQIANADQLNTIVDGCLKDATEAYQKGLKEGIKAGYAKKAKEIPQDSIDVTLPNEPTQAEEEMSLDLHDCQISLSIQRDSTLIYRTEMLIHKKQSKDRFWLILVLSALLVGSVWLHIKKLVKTNVSAK